MLPRKNPYQRLHDHHKGALQIAETLLKEWREDAQAELNKETRPTPRQRLIYLKNVERFLEVHRDLLKGA